MTTILKPATRITACIAMVVAVVVALSFFNVSDRPLFTALSLLVFVLLSSVRWGIPYAVFLSMLAALGLSWSIPPVGHFHLADSRVPAVLIVYLVSAFAASHLSNRQKRAEEAARRSERELRDLIENIPAMAFINLPGPSNAFASRGWREYTGLSAEGTAGSGWQSVVHPEDLEQHLEKWQVCAATGEPFENEARYRRADGEYRWFLVRAMPLRDAQGNILKWFGALTDIEDRKRAEEELRDSEQRLRAIFENEPECVKVLDADGCVLDMNSAGLQMIEADSLEQVRNSCVYSFISEEHHPAFRQLHEGVLRGESGTLEFQMVGLRGGRRWVETYASPLRDEHGRPVAAMGITRDITERKRAEAERERLYQLEADLAHMNRVSMMGELAASLAHEVKQPITAAITNARTCLRWATRDVPNLEEVRAAVRRMVGDNERAAGIIDRVRSLYKKSTPQRELVDPNELIQEIIVLLQSEAARCAILIGSELTDSVPRVMADRVQLQQVLLNLMLNGIEAMKESGGELTVKSQSGRDGQLLISVSDTGVGLPAEKADQIFNAFFTTKPQGSGMGLAISRSIVESHGGRLWACANSGRGATFQFTIPTEVRAASTSAG